MFFWLRANYRTKKNVAQVLFNKKRNNFPSPAKGNNEAQKNNARKYDIFEE